VADQYQPGKLRWPRYEGNDRTGRHRSNRTDPSSASGARRSAPSSGTWIASTRSSTGTPAPIPSPGSRSHNTYRSLTCQPHLPDP